MEWGMHGPIPFIIFLTMIDHINSYKVIFSLRKENYRELFRVKGVDGKTYYLWLINLAKLTDVQFVDDYHSVTEIELARGLRHANIMQICDTGEAIIDGQRYAYAAYDYFPGETLADRMLREGMCSVFETRQIVIGVLNALKYLHSLPDPIIHNGISPSSIMLNIGTGVPIPFLLDFGHACVLDNKSSPCFTEGLSPYYMAPELFRGLYSTRTDLYAVGALMYQMIFGIQPWEVETHGISENERTKVILEARKLPLPVPDVRVFELDENLLNIMAKALSQDVDKRFQSAEEFLNALIGVTAIPAGNYRMINVRSRVPAENPERKEERRGNGFADVAGLDELKQRLKDEVIDLLKEPDKYRKLRVKIPNGILLYGPPGCGKTFIAEKFAEELDCHFICVHCSDVASPYIHGGQEKIASLFQQAREKAPSILFLDEIDAMLTDRSRQTNVSEAGEVNEFLIQLNNCAEDGVFVIGATNKPMLIDPAALRTGRFDIKVYVPEPDEKEREALFRLQLKGIAAEDIDFAELARQTKGYVSKDICVLVNSAALFSAKQNKEAITMAAMRVAIERCGNDLPSVSAEELKKYEQIRSRFEARKSSPSPLGFR